jgi:hypothetical protein
MLNSNEQALLTYLEEQKEKTQSLLSVENHNLWYWKSGNHFKDAELQLTNDQVDFLIKNSEERIKPLKFRLEWLEKQIEDFNFFKNL